MSQFFYIDISIFLYFYILIFHNLIFYIFATVSALACGGYGLDRQCHIYSILYHVLLVLVLVLVLLWVLVLFVLFWVLWLRTLSAAATRAVQPSGVRAFTFSGKFKSFLDFFSGFLFYQEWRPSTSMSGDSRRQLTIWIYIDFQNN